jgi:hypothetical protein
LFAEQFRHRARNAIMRGIWRVDRLVIGFGKKKPRRSDAAGMVTSPTRPEQA